MSCFGGLMKEYSSVSIDRFDGANLSSRAYFLSHCHSDHMVGLDANNFFCHLEGNKDIRLYCSEVTGALLLADARYTRLTKHVQTLPIDDPTILDIEHRDGSSIMVSVTLVPAGHCPGSVMFFFEGKDGNVLYTGDFRMRKGSGQRMKFLHTSGGAKKPMKSMYVDTTFCRPDALFIPSREDCLKKLEKIVSEWLTKSKENAVRLNISAKYGYEYVFNALGKKFNTKIYCRNKSFYRCLPHIYDIITTDPEDARIYACFKTEHIKKQKRQDASSDGGEDEVPVRKNILRITLSTMYFIHEARPDEICHHIGKSHYRMCFSFHSSHSEVCDLVRYFQPENVYANVRPRNTETLEEVETRLAKDCNLKIAQQETTPQMRKTHIQKPKISVESVPPKIPSKRAISLGTDDDDSQELLDQLVNKYRNKQKGNDLKTEGCSEKNKSASDVSEDEFHNFPSHENDVKITDQDRMQTRKISSSNKPIPNVANDDYDISSSPESVNQSEIDDLHVKIALNGGMPPLL